MSRFIKRIFVFSIIILCGLFVLAYVSRNGTDIFEKKDKDLNFDSETDFLSPGTELR